MADPTADTVDMTWVLNELAKERGVINALLFTSDGLFMASSDGLPRDDADRSSATFAAMQSLNQDLPGFCGLQQGEVRWRHLTSDLRDYCVLLFAAGERTCIAVSVAGDAGSQEAAVATSATLKAITGLRPVLAARERRGPSGVS